MTKQFLAHAQAEDLKELYKGPTGDPIAGVMVVLKVKDLIVDPKKVQSRHAPLVNPAKPTDEDVERDPNRSMHDSVRDDGLLEPPRARRILDGEHKGAYSLVAGFRRIGALRDVAGDDAYVLCVVQRPRKDIKPGIQDRIENFKENYERKELAAWEFCVTMTELKKDTGWPEVEIARQIHIPRSTINNALRLHKDLCPELWKMFQDGRANTRDLLAVLAKPKAEQLAAYYGKADAPGGKRGRKKGAPVALRAQAVADIAQNVKENGVRDYNGVLHKAGSPFWLGFLECSMLVLKERVWEEVPAE